MEPVDTLRSLKLKKTAHYNVTTVLIGFISVILWCQHKGIISNFSLSLRMSWLLQVTWLFYWQHLCINRKPTLKRQLLWITILKKTPLKPKNHTQVHSLWEEEPEWANIEETSFPTGAWKKNLPREVFLFWKLTFMDSQEVGLLINFWGRLGSQQSKGVKVDTSFPEDLKWNISSCLILTKTHLPDRTIYINLEVWRAVWLSLE